MLCSPRPSGSYSTIPYLQASGHFSFVSKQTTSASASAIRLDLLSMPYTSSMPYDKNYCSQNPGRDSSSSYALSLPLTSSSAPTPHALPLSIALKATTWLAFPLPTLPLCDDPLGALLQILLGAKSCQSSQRFWMFCSDKLLLTVLLTPSNTLAGSLL